jgi:hypothetical protein
VAKVSRFFPTVAEIREHAVPLWHHRTDKVWGLRTMLEKHEREWEVPIAETDRCTPAEAAAIVSKFAAQRTAK